MAGDAIRIQYSVADRLHDRLFIDRNPYPFNAVRGSARQTVRKNDRFHGTKNINSKMKNNKK
jgi:hypothetical protein